MKIEICSGCGRYNIEPLGVNKNGEPFKACCPDSSYNEIETVLTRFFFEFIDFVVKRLPSKKDAEDYIRNKNLACAQGETIDSKSFMDGANWVSEGFDKAIGAGGEEEVKAIIVKYLKEEYELRDCITKKNK